jgi:hypothetical protein
MTDKEMAIQLGDYVNRKLRRITALESILKENQIPGWEEDAVRIAHEPLALAATDAHIHHLQYSISDTTPESELIRALHHLFVEP